MFGNQRDIVLQEHGAAQSGHGAQVRQASLYRAPIKIMVPGYCNDRAARTFRMRSAKDVAWLWCTCRR